MTDTFPATRSAALARLNAFVPRAAKHYADGRNSDSGPDKRANVSQLSPYLRHRLLTEQEVITAVLSRHSFGQAEKFVQEVCWRTYWKGWLELRPAVWHRFVAERDALAPGGGMAKAIESAERGATGIEGFDDWAHEIAEHGYLHNHARMWFASIWIFTLGLPWQAGADFFLRHLIDADPASNTLSWRWVAGLQTAGKTYLATADNIARYTNGRFSPKGLATSARPLSEAEPVPGVRPLAPAPAFDPRTPALLLLTGEDLAPESLLPKGAAIKGIHAVQAVPSWPWGEAASAFVKGAVTDAADRAALQFRSSMTTAAMLDAEALIAAAQKANAAAIVTAQAPVGSVADALAAIAPTLADAGVPLVQIRRAWDDRFWPLATKGFFPFKERIPAVLGELGLRAG